MFLQQKQKKIALIEMEKYYTFYYDDKWYVGHVISYDDNLKF